MSIANEPLQTFLDKASRKLQITPKDMQKIVRIIKEKTTYGSSIGKFLVELLQPQEGMRVYDPLMECGQLLVQVGDYIWKKGGNPRQLKVYGREADEHTYLLAKVNLLLHGMSDRYLDQCEENYDCILSYPSQEKRDFSLATNIVSQLSERGKAAIVMPQEVLSQNGINRSIRRELIEKDYLEAVIELPMYTTWDDHKPACILIFKRKKEMYRAGHVMLISNSTHPVHPHQYEHLMQRICDTYNKWQIEPSFAEIVRIDQLIHKQYNLKFQHHLTPVMAQYI